MLRIISLTLVAALLLCGPATAKDLYVKSGAEGDGSAKDKPLGTLWKAMDKAERGDVIHVTAGIYEGKGGSGSFIAKVPNLTIVGGYSDDFSTRNPFKTLTVLQRAKDYKGGATGLPDAILAGAEHAEHGGLIVDGLVLNSETRNTYDATGKLNAKDSWPGCILQTRCKDIKIRNCILLNGYGEGIYGAWSGKDNEISNCFVINTFREGISTRSAQPDSVTTIKNCTIAFCWFAPGKGGGMGVFVGRQGKTIIQDNVVAYMQTEGGEAGYAISNTFGNDNTILKGNVFTGCVGGYYAYMDADKKNLLAWKADDLKDINKDPGSYVLAEAGGNVEADAGIKPDKDWFEKFSNFVASEPGKLNMDHMNQVRQMLGLNLQAEPGSPRKNWGMCYPLTAVVPNLSSTVAGKGVQLDAKFATYASTSAAGSTASGDGGEKPAVKDYAAVEFDSFKKGADGLKDLAGKAVAFKCCMGDPATNYMLKNAGREDFACYKLQPAGETGATTKIIYAYIQKGSAAHKEFEKLLKKKADVNAAGITVQGTVWYAGTDTYAYPVGIIIDNVTKN